MSGKIFINNQWISGKGEHFESQNPATLQKVWGGNAASPEQIRDAITSARHALKSWSSFTFDERLEFLRSYVKEIKSHQEFLVRTISEEIGKPLWDAKTEVEATLNKLDISVRAYQERCPSHHMEVKGIQYHVVQKPHGVVGVFGPFNFPIHLPNGHMIPALLAGNTVVFKASELAPKVAEVIFQCFEKAKMPEGVVNLLQGGALVGKALSEHPDLNALFFTGSYRTGKKLQAHFLNTPGKMLSLEMGGNNPLIVHDIKNVEAAVYHTLESSFISSGQRCTCARRLIVTEGSYTKSFFDGLISAINKIKVGVFTENPEPFMGPVISKNAVENLERSYSSLQEMGAKALVPLKKLNSTGFFMSPSLIDVTSISELPDEELFGPILQCIRVKNVEEAIQKANQTEYGLIAGLLSDNKEAYEEFVSKIRTGVIAWNRPMTGASSLLPFGGIGKSGNFRPSAYYAADYCVYPMSCTMVSQLSLPETLRSGINLNE